MAFDFVDIDTLGSTADLQNYQKLVQEQIVSLHEDRGLKPLNDEQRAEDKRLKEQDKEIRDRLTEWEARTRYIEQMSRAGRVEADDTHSAPSRHAVRDHDIYDLSTIRSNYANPEAAAGELRERALRVAD